MHNVSKSRLFTVLGAIILTGAIACADSPTAPQIQGKRSVRDTTVVEGDSTLCRSGFIIMGGRIVCAAQ